jgi:hypothetical protein
VVDVAAADVAATDVPADAAVVAVVAADVGAVGAVDVVDVAAEVVGAMVAAVVSGTSGGERVRHREGVGPCDVLFERVRRLGSRHGEHRERRDAQHRRRQRPDEARCGNEHAPLADRALEHMERRDCDGERHREAQRGEGPPSRSVRVASRRTNTGQW